MVSPKQCAFVLTAVAVIFTANISPLISLVNYFIFTVLIQLVYFIIIGVHLLIPDRSEAILDAAFKWIKYNFRPLAIALFAIFGIFILFKGISGLIL